MKPLKIKPDLRIKTARYYHKTNTITFNPRTFKGLRRKIVLTHEFYHYIFRKKLEKNFEIKLIKSMPKSKQYFLLYFTDIFNVTKANRTKIIFNEMLCHVFSKRKLRLSWKAYCKGLFGVNGFDKVLKLFEQEYKTEIDNITQRIR